ncbi:MAG: hypothetical protein WC708_10895 [Lentisphaeria bacterium]
MKAAKNVGQAFLPARNVPRAFLPAFDYWRDSPLKKQFSIDKPHATETGQECPADLQSQARMPAPRSMPTVEMKLA